ncbi:tetratricopeptide repeat protein [Mucilaginibacter gotjawali]|uniref:Uncharacterized protein n=2 Tax=Mucilaginibacter gotjawali TaxID=1550579 RepID=A0A110B6C1_9SPHI|nr:hypothetical protein [Mucilaginibacter gotjawali]MBB3058748.1 tetratricopeptide (TPR) repeat protein [Mucilaginibacter gotjawali]BAU55648.1 hypothetical protein MgSA37_03839 [Mucilaginibacter gotjawali]
MNQPFLQKDLGEHWRTVNPEVIEPYEEQFWDAVDLMDQAPAKAERIFKKIIRACGDAHMDAILHLGLLFNDRNKSIEGNALIIKAWHIAKEALPADFIIGYDQILWSHMDNRPLLRVFQAYAVELFKAKDYERAEGALDFLLRVNPADNQGIRYLMLECLLWREEYLKILKLEEEYEGDYSADFLYGKALALLQLDKTEEAISQLAIAKSAFPHVAAEFAKAVHEFPFDEFEQSYIFEGVFPLGSKQEAFHYWSKTRKFWEKDGRLETLLKMNVL